jgi:hypothetical protein
MYRKPLCVQYWDLTLYYDKRTKSRDHSSKGINGRTLFIYHTWLAVVPTPANIMTPVPPAKNELDPPPPPPPPPLSSSSSSSGLGVVGFSNQMWIYNEQQGKRWIKSNI